MSKAAQNTISDLFDGGVTLPYKAGEVILRAGDTPSGVYLITKGTVKISSTNDKDEEVVRVIIGYGEIFPLLWAMKKPYGIGRPNC
jgi:CRP-like cAMP-binding protein